ncbi:MFS transporter [uncultured Draconibacterium sp.]|uniref:MFS transporter n=1 Tax=uncultured Draconibacterium sp. TaxID=1573823 RepID=UPI003217E5A4
MQNKNLVLLWTGKLVSALGDRMYAIAIAWWILEVTNSPTIMGLYLLSATLPMVLLGLVAGAVIDKSNLKNVLVIADVVRGVGIVLLGILFQFGNLSLLSVFAVTVVVSLSSAFFNPAVTSIIPHIVSKNKLGNANSLVQLVDGVAKVAGPFAGVAVVAGVGYSGAFYLNGVSFLLSAFFEVFIRYNHKKTVWATTSDKKLKTRRILTSDIKEGLVYVWGNEKLLHLLFYIFAAHFFVGAVSVMLPVMAKFVSNNNLNLLGILEAVLGAGFVVGALFLSRLHSDKFNADMLPKIFTILACCFIGIGSIAHFDHLPVWLFVPPVFMIGYCIVYASINWKTFIQTDTPKEKLGRVAAISSLVGDITLPVAFALYGFLFDRLNFAFLTILSGILLIVSVNLIGLKSRQRLASVIPLKAESGR